MFTQDKNIFEISSFRMVNQEKNAVNHLVMEAKSAIDQRNRFTEEIINFNAQTSIISVLHKIQSSFNLQ